jgi:hypothetical protein
VSDRASGRDESSDDGASQERAAALDILSDLVGLFASALALDAWGRILVELVEAGTNPDGSVRLAVADLLVDEVLDDAKVDAAFASAEARSIMPTVALAIDALSALEGLDARELGGGTFVRIDEAPGLAFLPGRVRSPSRSLDARTEELAAKLEARAEELRATHGIGVGAALDVDLAGGTFVARRNGVAVAQGEHVVIGSFVWSRRGWAWGAQNPSLPEPVRARSAAAFDRIADRSLWEIATPGFQCDEATVWTLAALVVVENDLAGASRIDLGDEGFLLLGLRSVRGVENPS